MTTNETAVVRDSELSGDANQIRMVPLPPQVKEKIQPLHLRRSEGPDIRSLVIFFDQTYRNYCQSVLWGILVALLSLAPLLYWCGGVIEAARGNEEPFWLASILLALCIGACVRLFTMPVALRQAGDMLIASNSLYAIGPLLDIFYSGGAALHDDAAKAPLTELLRRLVDEKGAREAREILRESQRQVLRQTLVAPLSSYTNDDRFKYDPTYLTAAIGALVHVEDLGALPEIERLAEESRHEEVRTAARTAFMRLRGLEQL